MRVRSSIGAVVMAAAAVGGGLSATAATTTRANPTQATGTAPVPVPPKRPPRFVFTFEGRGYGHGVGMSQWGAYGQALAGRSAEEIIASYYRGTTLSTLPVTPVRVLLGSGPTPVELSATGDWKVILEGVATNATRVLPAGTEITAVREGTGVVLTGPEGDEILASPGPVRIVPGGKDIFVAHRATRYRGELRLIPDGDGLTVVNLVDLEDYLRGVVPREMPAKWGTDAPAALEAQAIVARTYAMATKRTGGVFDMYPDERSQVYGGVNSEDPRTNDAVTASTGTVVTKDGNVVVTYFFSTSGGMTENVENIFRGSPRSYLVAVDDEQYDVLSPHHVWRDPKTYTDLALAKRVGLKSRVLKITILERGVSPRAKLVRFTAINGTFKDVRGTDVRKLLGLRDTWFTPKRQLLTPTTARLVRELPFEPGVRAPAASAPGRR